MKYYLCITAVMLTSCATTGPPACKITCSSAPECVAIANDAFNGGNAVDAACIFHAALLKDPTSDDARLGYATSITIIGRSDLALPEFQRIITSSQNPERVQTAKDWIALLQQRIPVIVYYEGAQQCPYDERNPGESSAKWLCYLLKRLGVFDLVSPQPIQIRNYWECCPATTPTAELALVMHATCLGPEETHIPLGSSSTNLGYVRKIYYRGGVTIDLYDARERRLLKRFRANGKSYSPLNSRQLSTALAIDYATESILLPLMNTILVQR